MFENLRTDKIEPTSPPLKFFGDYSYLKKVQKMFENLKNEKIEYSDDNSFIRVF